MPEENFPAEHLAGIGEAEERITAHVRAFEGTHGKPPPVIHLPIELFVGLVGVPASAARIIKQKGTMPATAPGPSTGSISGLRSATQTRFTVRSADEKCLTSSTFLRKGNRLALGDDAAAAGVNPPVAKGGANK